MSAENVWKVIGSAAKSAVLASSPDASGGELITKIMALIDTDSDEKITKEELATYATSIGQEFSEEDLAAAIAMADKDADGYIDAFEFETVLTTCQVL